MKIYDRLDSWKAYLEEVDDVHADEIRRKTHKGLALGTEEFIIKLERRLKVILRELKAGRPYKKQ